MICGSLLGCADIGLLPLVIGLVGSAAAVLAVRLLIVCFWKRYERRQAIEAEAAFKGNCDWDVMLKTGGKRIAGGKTFTFFFDRLEEFGRKVSAP